jgi:hypothetical protein
MVDTIF